ncbi:hypothetical protein LTR08_008101 [Meristemomyces frigidus]|nr:hypothetical protein LTR08_008101 [Meristemomyces frigidus]
MADQHPSAVGLYLANTLSILWYICWPVGVFLYYLAIAVLTIVKLLYQPVGFLLQPLVYVGHFILACLIAPFRLLVKFETLYIYLGIAAIVGLVIGLLVSYVYSSLSGILRLDPKPEQPLSRSAREYREAKQAKKARAEAPLASSGSLLAGDAPPNQVFTGHASTSDSMSRGRRGKGLLHQTIMEEVSDY